MRLEELLDKVRKKREESNVDKLKSDLSRIEQDIKYLEESLKLIQKCKELLTRAKELAEELNVPLDIEPILNLKDVNKIEEPLRIIDNLQNIVNEITKQKEKLEEKLKEEKHKIVEAIKTMKEKIETYEYVLSKVFNENPIIPMPPDINDNLKLQQLQDIYNNLENTLKTIETSLNSHLQQSGLDKEEKDILINLLKHSSVDVKKENLDKIIKIMQFLAQKGIKVKVSL